MGRRKKLQIKCRLNRTWTVITKSWLSNIFSLFPFSLSSFFFPFLPEIVSQNISLSVCLSVHALIRINTDAIVLFGLPNNREIRNVLTLLYYGEAYSWVKRWFLLNTEGSFQESPESPKIHRPYVVLVLNNHANRNLKFRETIYNLCSPELLPVLPMCFVTPTHEQL